VHFEQVYTLVFSGIKYPSLQVLHSFSFPFSFLQDLHFSSSPITQVCLISHLLFITSYPSSHLEQIISYFDDLNELIENEDEKAQNLRECLIVQVKNTLSKEEKMKIALGIINGINYLHSNNIIHCHLSSKNILLDDELNPIIVDFGLRNSNINRITVSNF